MPTFPSIDYVMSLTPGGMREGRDNVLKLMEMLGNPQDTLRVFHVTGSNGKGSVCQMISQVLWKQLGKKVGLFTSPHLIKINERFQINGVLISDEDLNNYYEKVIGLGKIHKIPLSFFEIQVVAMVLYFVDQGVDYAVVEVGLGGLYDGTNIFSHPLACFITSITLEHTHLLGKTRQSVLRNKLGIVKKGSKLYTGLDNKLVREYCAKIGAKKIEIKFKNASLISPGEGGRKNQLKKGGLEIGDSDNPLYPPLSRGQNNGLTNLPGKHQQKNASLVLQSLVDIGFAREEILKGLQKIENIGRFQWLTPNILLDSANNTENIKILAQMIKQLSPEKGGKEGCTVIFGTTQVDPAYAAKLAKMIPAEKRILIDDFCDRALPCSEYESTVPHDEVIHWNKYNNGGGSKKKNTINRFIELSNYPGGTVVIIYGSIYLIGEILKLSINHSFAKR